MGGKYEETKNKNLAAFARVYVIPIIEILTKYHSDTVNYLSARFEGQRSVDTDNWYKSERLEKIDSLLGFI